LAIKLEAMLEKSRTWDEARVSEYSKSGSIERSGGIDQAVRLGERTQDFVSQLPDQLFYAKSDIRVVDERSMLETLRALRTFRL
jgi:hypothetical protein